MQTVQQAPDHHWAQHLEEARRVLSLPVQASGLRWHPFGVYVAPLARRRIDGHDRVRRLHVWHPEAKPVGPASPYGVHTHTETAFSHVIAGALDHHLYGFQTDQGPWIETPLGGTPRPAALLWHSQATTTAGTTHTLPAHQPHSVSKPPGPPGFAISLFEQIDGPKEAPFTTWQRTDTPPEPLVRTPPVDVRIVQAQALAILENHVPANRARAATQA